MSTDFLMESLSFSNSTNVTQVFSFVTSSLFFPADTLCPPLVMSTNLTDVHVNSTMVITGREETKFKQNLTTKIQRLLTEEIYTE